MGEANKMEEALEQAKQAKTAEDLQSLAQEGASIPLNDLDQAAGGWSGWIKGGGEYISEEKVAALDAAKRSDDAPPCDKCGSTDTFHYYYSFVCRTCRWCWDA